MHNYQLHYSTTLSPGLVQVLANINLTRQQSKNFFALLATKNLAPHPPGGAHHRGYSAPELAKVTQNRFDANELSKAREVPDYKESLESGNVHDEMQPNIWPPVSALPGFRAFMESFLYGLRGTRAQGS